MLFEDLNLIQPIAKAIKVKWYSAPTPIQSKTIPALLNWKDVMWCAQTGTGKTAAFAIPILQLLYNSRQTWQFSKGIKALIITPTRELAIQINDSFSDYGKWTNLKQFKFSEINKNAFIFIFYRWILTSEPNWSILQCNLIMLTILQKLLSRSTSTCH